MIQSIINENPWQRKLYDKPLAQKFINLFVPKKGTREYTQIVKLLKDLGFQANVENMMFFNGKYNFF